MNFVLLNQSHRFVIKEVALKIHIFIDNTIV